MSMMTAGGVITGYPIYSMPWYPSMTLNPDMASRSIIVMTRVLMMMHMVYLMASPMVSLMGF